MHITQRHLAGLLVWLLIGLLSTTATAQMYQYETPDGDVLITTERQNDPGYTLIEKLSSPGSTDSSSESSSSSDSDSSSSATAAESKYGMTPTTGSSTRSFSEREAAYDDLIREAADAYDVPFGFIKAVMRVESAFQYDAISHAGAMGLMQLMPATAESLGVDDPFDVRQNVFGGAKFLRILIDRYDGDINLILAAYNAGDVAVRRHDGIPYAQTRNYVVSVYYWYEKYSAEEDDP